MTSLKPDNKMVQGPIYLLWHTALAGLIESSVRDQVRLRGGDWRCRITQQITLLEFHIHDQVTEDLAR